MNCIALVENDNLTITTKVVSHGVSDTHAALAEVGRTSGSNMANFIQTGGTDPEKEGYLPEELTRQFEPHLIQVIEQVLLLERDRVSIEEGIVESLTEERNNQIASTELDASFISTPNGTTHYETLVSYCAKSRTQMDFSQITTNVGGIARRNHISTEEAGRFLASLLEDIHRLRRKHIASIVNKETSKRFEELTPTSGG